MVVSSWLINMKFQHLFHGNYLKRIPGRIQLSTLSIHQVNYCVIKLLHGIYTVMYLQALFLLTVHWSVSSFTSLLMITMILQHSICSWMAAKMKRLNASQRYCINSSEETTCMCDVILVQETYMSVCWSTSFTRIYSIKSYYNKTCSYHQQQ